MLIDLRPFGPLVDQAREVIREYPVIGLHGRAHAGKDAVGGFMVRQGFRRVAFADAVKRSLQHAFSLSDDQTWNPDLKEAVIPHLGVTFRRLMQTIATEVFRDQVDCDIWLRAAMQSMIAAVESRDWFSGFVVTDVRFENEAAFIRRLGGTVVHIERPNSGIGSTHSSEAGIAFCAGDLRLRNDGSLSDLEARSRELLDRIVMPSIG